MAGTCPTCGEKVAGNLAICPDCGCHVLLSEGICPQCNSSIPEYVTPLTPEPKPFIFTTKETSAPTSKSKAHRLRPWLYGMLFILLVSGGGFYAYCQWQNELQERAYQRIQEVTNPDLCQDFLTRYPYSVHREEVEERMLSLIAEAEEWNVILEAPTKKALTAFIENHPGSAHIRECKMLEDSLDWAIALKSKTEKSVTTYLEEHPEGEYTEDANKLIEQIKLCKVTPQNVTMVRGVIESFFTHAFIDGKVKDIKEDLAKDTILFCDSRATAKEILTHSLSQKEKDIIGRHFMVSGNPSITKSIDDEGVLTIDVHCTVTQTINRSNAKKNHSLAHRVVAKLTEDYKLTNITIK